MSDLTELAQRLGHRFGSTELLEQAVTHPSVAGMSVRSGERNYERLEFLGDRVLGLVMAEMLLERFPDEAEGDLAKRHTAVVQREALAEVAQAIELGRFLRLATGEESTGGRSNPAILADACEAVIAAIYLDGGLPAAAGFVRSSFEPLLDRYAVPPQDPKTALQEWAQGRGRPLPSYREVGRSGPAHEPEFEIEVSVAGLPPVRGKGTSKRAAEKAAAAAMLQKVT